MSTKLPQPIKFSTLTKLDKFDLIRTYITAEINRADASTTQYAMAYNIRAATKALENTFYWYIDPEMASGIIIDAIPGTDFKDVASMMYDLLYIMQKDRVSCSFNGTIVTVSCTAED